jgi:hypothetical protein
MDTLFAASFGESGNHKLRPLYRPGDVVMTTTGYPSLYEVMRVEPDGLLRVRGNNWEPGYTSTVSPGEVRPVNQILYG